MDSVNILCNNYKLKTFNVYLIVFVLSILSPTDHLILKCTNC